MTMELVHSWARAVADNHVSEFEPATGGTFELTQGRYVIVSDMTVAVDRLTSPPETPVPDREWCSVFLTADQKFIVAAVAIFRISYPCGGRGITELFKE